MGCFQGYYPRFRLHAGALNIGFAAATEGINLTKATSRRVGAMKNLTKEELAKLLQENKVGEFDDYHAVWRIQNPGQVLDLSGIRLSNILLRNLDLAGCCLSGLIAHKVDFTGCDLNRADLSNANLTDCGFYDGSMTGTNLMDAMLQRCDFQEMNLDSTELQGVRGLEICRFIRCWMTQSQLDTYFAAITAETTIIGR